MKILDKFGAHDLKCNNHSCESSNIVSNNAIACENRMPRVG